MFICLVFVLGLGGCGTVVPTDTVTQISTLDAILAGAYDGQITCRELISHGDLGIGTFDDLDGEMVLVDGEMYQVKADGKVYSPSLETESPFAVVVKFEPRIKVKLNGPLNFQQFVELMDKEVPATNLFFAARVSGRFESMRTRSVPPQKKPYPPLAEVTKNQPEFDLKDVSGTIVGFRCPAYVKGINMPGYHLHFLSDDLDSGGHVLDFVLDKGMAEIDLCSRFLMILPEGDSDFAGLDLGVDRSEDLEKAER
jgi:acetolactate decarboxylase